MWIYADVERFKPENFVIVKFYEEETCFAWQNKNLVVFPYAELTTSTPRLPVIVAPREIKRILSYNSRVFVICKPAGIYKMNKSLKFCPLSQTGIGLGSFFYQVFSVENHWLYMKDKMTKSNRQLFQLNNSDCHNISEIMLNPENSDYDLRKALCQLGDDTDEDICIIANARNIFAITSRDVQLIHHCEQEIIDIVAIYKEETVAGFVLVAQNAAVLVYVNNRNLIFDKVHLETDVRGLCAGINVTSSDTIWIAHTDHKNIYYSAKTMSTDVFRRTGMDSRKLLAIRNYKNETLIGLSDNKQLMEIEIQTAGLGLPNSEEFVDLKPEMLKGSEAIVNEVCERAKELQLLNNSLLEGQEKLKRINIYAHKQAILYLPNVRVERIAGQLFLRIKFGNVLPINCHVVVVLKLGFQTTFSLKLVEDSEVVVDVPVDHQSLETSLELSIDLVTLANESQSWCLIRNYVKNPHTENTRIPSDRMRFLTAKLAALQNFTADGNLDMKKLSSIKKSIRKELK